MSQTMQVGSFRESEKLHILCHLPYSQGFIKTLTSEEYADMRCIRRTTMIVALILSVNANMHLAAADDAASEFSADDLQFFATEVAPLLKEHCYKCHAGEKAKGGLRLTSRESLLKGGDSGAAVDLQDIDGSLLLQAVNYDGYEMPPSGKLPDEQIALLRRWVERGLPMPNVADEPPAEEGHHSPEVNEETKSHWSFQPVKRPHVPDVQNASWVANPIDSFVIAKLEDAGLSPAPPAERTTLIRRVTYDLTGLPPSPDEVAAFVADESPDAYENLIERLLESPHYGEHWARYWLDLVRYAESNSFERDNPKPFVWRYRDYVIQSLNDDKPYDQFVMEQLAGDELDEVTSESLIATGYYRLGLWDDEPADPLLAFYDGLDDIAATTSQAMLGLRMNCARCHEHKIDPIPQQDYYSFIAFFRNIRHYGVRADATVFEASIRDVDLPDGREQRTKAVTDWEKQLNEIKTRMAGIETEAAQHLVGGEKDDFQDQSSRFDILKRRAGEVITKDQFETYDSLRKVREKLEKSPPGHFAQVLSIKEQGPDAPPTHVLVRGNPHIEGDEVNPAFPSVLSPPAPVIEAPDHGESTGRRRALAEWIVSPENPLSARVMINRIWQWHFGRGIVRSPNNFGLQGDRPTHPKLLDWLSAEFVDRGWSLKAIHRLILMSNTYRMSAIATDEVAGTKTDPDNNLLWRFDMRRLRAEEIRDSILAVNDTLNTDKMFGPSIYPVIPDEILAGQSRPGENWGKSSEEDVTRRSIYIHSKRSLPVPLLAAFDVANTEVTCPARFATTQPTQALGMLNSAFINKQAEVFAQSLRQQAGDEPAAQVRLALQRITQREPTDAEVQRGIDLMNTLEHDHGMSANDSLRYFCLTVLNLNEFLYLD
ncbi:MAG: PSD1 domain-containing protein [Planctomycetaceae bacterium]|nr:PSD1 domain-containing protein [Planctomycetaceae bacterium]